METSIMAVLIGLIISGISYFYGKSNGIRLGQQKGISMGVYMGTISIISALTTTKLIKITSDEEKKELIYVGNDDNTLTSSELINICSPVGESK
jgi:hypothetical protein